jgi:integrase/recombinase XerD
VNGLAQAAEEYLLIRRALGFKLQLHGRLLPGFVAFLEDAGATFITTDLALEWATRPAGSATWCAARLSIARGFARHLATIDGRTQVPPVGLLQRPGRASRRAVPYLYSSQDIAGLMAAARELRPLQAATYETLVGLLAVSGLRVGEAIRLDCGDLDDEHSMLVVRDTKFAKSRQVPLHETTLAALHEYLRRRDELHPNAAGPSLFVSTTGTRLLYKVVQPTFARLCERAGLQPRSPRCRPRLHDLRHSLAVSTLLDWYRSGADIGALLPRLSTLLGHTDPASTYWYLQAAPELLALAACRLQHAAQDLS